MADETITMDVKQIRDEIYKGMRIFKAFENAHQVLGALEGMEGLSYEIQDRLKKMKAEEADIVAKRDAMLADAENVKKMAVESAKSLVDGAKKTADEALAKAHEASASLKEDALAAVADITAKHDTIKDAHDELSTSLVGKKIELKKINDALAQSKSELSKFLGK